MNRKEAKELITEQITSDINRTKMVGSNTSSAKFMPTEIVIETVQQNYGTTTTRTYFIATPVYITDQAVVTYGQPTKINAATVSEIANLGQQVAWAEQRRDKKTATSSRINALLNVDETADYYTRDVAGQELAERVNQALNINPASRSQFRDCNRFGEGATVTITLTIAEVEALLAMKAGA
jgi:hypothetical protein